MFNSPCKKNIMKLRDYRGVTLIEALIALSLLALVLGMLIQMFSSSSKNNKNLDFSTRLDANVKLLFKHFEQDIRSAKRIWASDKNTLNMIKLSENQTGKIIEKEISYVKFEQGVKRMTENSKKTFLFLFSELSDSSFDYTCFISKAGQLVIELKYRISTKKPEVSTTRHFRLPGN